MLRSVDEAVFWYDQKTNKHEAVVSYVRALDEDQQYVHRANKAHAHLYSNRYEPGMDDGEGQYRSGYAAITENVIASVTDTATSMIAKTRPKAAVMTDGAEWSVQRLARKLDKFLWGMFQSLSLHAKMVAVFRDSCIFGTGCVRVFKHRGRVKVERVLIDDILVDETSVPNSGDGPQQLHQIRTVSKAKLKQLFPKHAEKIDQSCEGVGRRAQYTARSTNNDMVTVIESWKRGPKGRYVMATDKVTLVDEPYEKDHFPHVFFAWSPPLTGFYGQGLAEALIGFQIRLNELNDFIRECQDLVAVPRVLIEAGSRMLPDVVTNEIAAQMFYTGQKPDFFTPTALGPETYNYVERIKSSAFEFAGISKMAAHATRPEGIEAAVALRELSDNQSQRFSIQQQRFEETYLTVGRRILECAKELVTSGKTPAKWMDSQLVKDIDWEMVDFEEERFVLSLQVSSSLNETPAARKQYVIELQQYGVQLRPSEVRKLLAHPDIDQSDAEATAAEEYADWVVDELSESRFIPPDAFEDLNLTFLKCNAAYLNGIMAGAPERILDLFRRRMKLTETLQKKTEQAIMAEQQAAALQAAPQQGVPAQPQAQPPQPQVA